MNTENNQQDQQDDGILSFDDAISPKDSEKQSEINTADTAENPSAEASSEQKQETEATETHGNWQIHNSKVFIIIRKNRKINFGILRKNYLSRNQL